MDFEKLARRAKEVYTERGGSEAAREDAAELEGILQGDGTLVDKAKRAAKALKEPGGPQDASGPSSEQPPHAPRGE